MNILAHTHTEECTLRKVENQMFIEGKKRRAIKPPKLKEGNIQTNETENKYTREKSSNSKVGSLAKR